MAIFWHLFFNLNSNDWSLQWMWLLCEWISTAIYISLIFLIPFKYRLILRVNLEIPFVSHCWLGIEIFEIRCFNLQAHLWYYPWWEYGILLRYKLFHWLSGYITLDIGISALSGHLSSSIGKFFKVQNKNHGSH